MLLALFVFLLSAGQVLFKKTALSAAALTTPAAIFGLLTNLWFWAALVVYGAATLLWIVILQKMPLSVAYPFVACGFIIVPLASWLFFREPLSPLYMLGVLLIIAGVGFITATSQG